MTKYVVFIQHVSLNTILLISFQCGFCLILVMMAKPIKLVAPGNHTLVKSSN